MTEQNETRLIQITKRRLAGEPLVQLSQLLADCRTEIAGGNAGDLHSEPFQNTGKHGANAALYLYSCCFVNWLEDL